MPSSLADLNATDKDPAVRIDDAPPNEVAIATVIACSIGGVPVAVPAIVSWAGRERTERQPADQPCGRRAAVAVVSWVVAMPKSSAAVVAMASTKPAVKTVAAVSAEATMPAESTVATAVTSEATMTATSMGLRCSRARSGDGDSKGNRHQRSRKRLARPKGSTHDAFSIQSWLAGRPAEPKSTQINAGSKKKVLIRARMSRPREANRGSRMNPHERQTAGRQRFHHMSVRNPRPFQIIATPLGPCRRGRVAEILRRLPVAFFLLVKLWNSRSDNGFHWAGPAYALHSALRGSCRKLGGRHSWSIASGAPMAFATAILLGGAQSPSQPIRRPAGEPAFSRR